MPDYDVIIQRMKNFLQKNKWWLIGSIAGAIGGFLWYYFVGCSSGTCPITSRPLNSTLYGAVMGGLLFSMFRKEPTAKEKSNQ